MTVNPLLNLDKVQPDDLDSGPIVVLNMLKFKSRDRLTQYLRYAAGVLEGWKDKGVEAVYAGELKERVNGEMGDWDYVLLVHYPSRRVFYDMLRSDAYQAIHPDREAALSDGVLWPSEPVISFSSPSRDFVGGEWQTIFESFGS